MNIALCMLDDLATVPTTAGDHESPNAWIEKMARAIALARRAPGTDRKMTALTGDVKGSLGPWVGQSYFCSRG